MVSCRMAFGQDILRIVKSYALVNMDESSGLKIGKSVTVWRISASGKKQLEHVHEFRLFLKFQYRRRHPHDHEWTLFYFLNR